MRTATALKMAADRLRQAGVDDPVTDARRLLTSVLALPADRLSIDGPEVLEQSTLAAFSGLLARREAREPVSHILGVRQFYRSTFFVNADVLDPRPDTETLVRLALEVPFRTVLDLGTGSGAILLSLITDPLPSGQMRDIVGVGTDVSQAALAVARRNAAALGVQSRVELRQSDWFTQVEGRFDLIVSNPPYIAADEMAALAPEVRDHEPHLALTDGADGLTAYRAILKGATAHLVDGGRILLEIGPTQAAAVTAIATANGWREVTVHPDLDGRDRVVEIRQNATNASILDQKSTKPLAM